MTIKPRAPSRPLDAYRIATRSLTRDGHQRAGPQCHQPTVAATLSTLCLYRAGYDFKRLFTISEYYDRDRPAFYAALQGVREADMDLTGWLEYFVSGLETQLQEVRARGEQSIRADVIVSSKKLNARQASLVAAFLERANLSLADCEKVLPDVARRTVQRDLKHLVDAGLIGEVGQGPTDPTRHYRWLGGDL